MRSAFERPIIIYSSQPIDSARIAVSLVKFSRGRLQSLFKIESVLSAPLCVRNDNGTDEFEYRMALENVLLQCESSQLGAANKKLQIEVFCDGKSALADLLRCCFARQGH